MSRIKRSAAAEAMGRALHDLAQPLGAAALSVDAAALLLAQGATEPCRERIEAAGQGLDRALLLVRLLKLANGGVPGHRLEAFDPAEVFRAIGQDLPVSSLGSMRADRGFFETALAGLVMALSPLVERVRIGRKTRGGALPVTLQGRGGGLAVLRFWARVLRRAGVDAVCRAGDDGFEVTLRLPLRQADAAAKPGH